MAGYGLSADKDGNIFFATGNTGAGTADHTLNFAESVVKMSGDLSVLDISAPDNAKLLDTKDLEIGSGGVMLVPDTSSGSLPHMAVAAGKDGRLFILNRDNLGGFHTPDLPSNIQIDPCLCGPSYFEGSDGKPRIASSGGHTLRTWIVDTTQSPALVSEAASPVNETAEAGGFFTSISSEAKRPGTAIIWAVGGPMIGDPSNGLILYAFDATAFGASLPLLWLGFAGSWQSLGSSSNDVPTVANGLVYVASYRQLHIFGQKRPQPAPVGIQRIDRACRRHYVENIADTETLHVLVRDNQGLSINLLVKHIWSDMSYKSELVVMAYSVLFHPVLCGSL